MASPAPEELFDLEIYALPIAIQPNWAFVQGLSHFVNSRSANCRNEINVGGAFTYAPLWEELGAHGSIPLEGSRCFASFGKGKVNMPRYFFIARRTATEIYDPDGTVLSDVGAALAHAESIIEDLRKTGSFHDDLTIIVKNELHERVLSIPFLPACG